MENLVPSMPIPIIPLPNASPSSITALLKTYAVLKEKLQAKGYVFKSSTDTEVLVQLIEYIQVTTILTC